MRVTLLPFVLSTAACYAGSSGDGTDTDASTGAGSAGSFTSGNTSNPSTTATTATSATSASSATSATSAPSDSSGGGAETAEGTTGVDPGVPEVHYVGRYDDSDPTHVRFGWGATGIVFRFSGTGASVTLADDAQFHTVVVDGEVQPTLATSSGEQSYVLASGLPEGEHTIEVYRRTEGFFGTTTFAGVELEGELLPPPPVTRRIEAVGDSITAGYGNEGVSPCSFSADTENSYMTYPAIAARAVGAELSMIAWSGKGIVYNYGDDVNEPMPTLYDRWNANQGDAWDFSIEPDVVTINLGTNDFSTDNDPSEELYVGTYVDFVAHIRDNYPNAYILLLSPSLSGSEATMVDGYLQQVVDTRTSAGDPAIGWANVNVDWIGSGCDGHPTVATHMGMGERLTEELQTRLGW